MLKGEHLIIGNIPNDERKFVLVTPPDNLNRGYYEIEAREAVLVNGADAQFVLAVLMWAKGIEIDMSEYNTDLLEAGLDTQGGDIYARGEGRITDIGRGDKLTGRIIFSSNDTLKKVGHIFRAAGMRVNE